MAKVLGSRPWELWRPALSDGRGRATPEDAARLRRATAGRKQAARIR